MVSAMKKDNLTFTLIKLLKSLKIPVTQTSIIRELERHPDYPSFSAISDLLSLWNIPHGAFRIESKDVESIPLPFLAHLSSKGGEFAVVNGITESSITLSNERWDNYTITRVEFSHLFTGNIMVIEAGQDSGESQFYDKRKTELLKELRLPFFVSAFVLITILAILQYSSFLPNLNGQKVMLAIFKTGGLITSILLLIHSIDSNNFFVEHLCSIRKSNCNAILSSKAAKITEELSWSEVGFFYFAGTWIYFLFNSDSLAGVQVLAFLNVLCLPYSLYSIYYQSVIVKQWCIFCSIIQFIFWLEFLAFQPYFYQSLLVLNFSEASNLLISGTVPILLWMFIRPYMLKSQEIYALKTQLRKFKYNSSIFYKKMEEQVRYVLPNESDTIILGNEEAENVITIVSNPYCQPCAKAHKILEEWLSERDSFKVQIIFSTQNHRDDPRTKVAIHLHCLNDANNKALTERAIHDWYNQKQKKYQDWINTYPVNEVHAVNDFVKKQKDWCELAQIEVTPTIFLNGYAIPKPWQLEDIKYFI